MENKNRLLYVLLGSTLVALIILYAIVLTKSEKIAYIDTNKLLEKSKGMIALRKQIETETSGIKSNVDTLSAEFQKQLKDYEVNQNKMTTKEKQLSQELLRNKQSQLIQYQQAVQEKVKQKEHKMSQDVLTNINTYISEYGQRKGYKLIFATSQGNIAYGDKGVDITDEIIEGINK